MKIGYARVSTEDQMLNLQLDALIAAGCEMSYEECASGKSAARPELENCLKALRTGDTLKQWHEKKPELFLKNVYKQAKLDIFWSSRPLGSAYGLTRSPPFAP